MNIKMVVAILLVALGVIAFAYQGITYTSPGKSFDLGPMHVSTEETHHIPFVASGPTVPRSGSVCDEFVNLVDLMPTFLDLAGTAPPEGAARRPSCRSPA